MAWLLRFRESVPPQILPTFLQAMGACKHILRQMDVAETLINWYQINKRDLPWRDTRDPYLIWLSEIILQQTRVAQGTPYYHKFVDAFPEVGQLAAAPQEEVLKLWQGLGYYSRARNLHAAAQQVVEMGTFSR